MKTNVLIDEVGRLVLPKTVRDAVGIVGRMTVAVEVVGGVAQISPPPPPSGPIKRKGGRLVYAGTLPRDWDSGEAVSRMREGRTRR
jgi:bifunctional DNA-binding transcriptional regulator/antitoxin component of YhaV-PrlF toxin-antitoxin module